MQLLMHSFCSIYCVLTVVCCGEFICLSECEYVYVCAVLMEVRGQKYWIPWSWRYMWLGATGWRAGNQILVLQENHMHSELLSCSSSLSTLFLKISTFKEPGACWFTRTSCTTSSRDLLFSTHAAFPLVWGYR